MGKNVDRNKMLRETQKYLSDKGVSEEIIEGLIDVFYQDEPKPRGIGSKIRTIRMGNISRKPRNWTERSSFTYLTTPSVVVYDDANEYRWVNIQHAHKSGFFNPGLLVTPKGKGTMELKSEIFSKGWDKFLEDNPTFKVYSEEELKLVRVGSNYIPDQQQLVFKMWMQDDSVFRIGVIFPSNKKVSK